MADSRIDVGRHGPKCVFLIFSILCFSAYIFSIGNYFLFDDFPNIVANPALKDFHPQKLFSWFYLASSGNSTPLGRPVSMMSFGLDRVFADRIASHAEVAKAINISVHVVTSFFVCAIFVRVSEHLFPDAPICRRRYAAVLAGSLWLFAPVHISTVLYPVQRMAQLSTLFVLLGVWVFVEKRSRWTETRPKPVELISLAMWLCILTSLAILSKENGVVLVLIVALTELCIFKSQIAGRSSSLSRHFSFLALFLPIAVVMLMLLGPLNYLIDPYDQRPFDIKERLLTQVRVLWTYMQWIVAPTSGAFGFAHDDYQLSKGLLDPATTLFALMAWMIVIYVVVINRNRYPWLVYSIAFYLLSHSVESTILPLELVFEHRNYLPSVGIFLGLGFTYLQIRGVLGSRTFKLCVIGYVSFFLMQFLVSVVPWKSDLDMALASVSNHPQSSRSHYFLSRAYERRISNPVPGDDLSPADYAYLSRESLVRMNSVTSAPLLPKLLMFIHEANYYPASPLIGDYYEDVLKLMSKDALSASEINALQALSKLPDLPGLQDESAIDDLLSMWQREHPESVDAFLARYSRAISKSDLQSADNLYEDYVRHNGCCPRIESLVFQRKLLAGDVAGAYLVLIEMIGGGGLDFVVAEIEP